MNDAYPTLPVDTVADRLEFDIRAARRGINRLLDNSVREITCFHVLQYLNGQERIFAWNEWYRVLEPAGRVHVIVPHYAHIRAFAHPLAQYPPLSDLSFFFLSRTFREQSSMTAVAGLECDFEVESLEQHVDSDPQHGYVTRTQDWLDNATKWFWNVAAELDVWLVKR